MSIPAPDGSGGRRDGSCEVRKRGKSYYIDVRLDGFGRFRKSAGKNKATANGWLADIVDLHREGELELLTAVRSGEISLPVMASIKTARGIKGLREHLRSVRQPSTKLSLRELLTPWLRDSDVIRDTTAETRKKYRRHGLAFCDALAADLGRRAMPQDVTWPRATWFADIVKHRRLVDRVRLRLAKEEIARHNEGSRDPLTLKEQADRKRSKTKEVEAMARDDPEEFYGHCTLKDQRAAGATANRYLISIRALCSWLVRQGHLPGNPIQSCKVFEEVKHNVNSMTRSQWARFREESLALDDEQNINASEHPLPSTLLWDLLLTTGATTYDEGVDSLTLGSFKPERVAPKGRALVQVEIDGSKTANRANRRLWIPRSLFERVQQHAERFGIGPNELLFACPRSEGGPREPFTGHRVRDAFRRVLERLAAKGEHGFEDFVPYNLRDTFAVWQLQGDPERGIPGVDIAKLAELMGHGNNITTTMRYAAAVNAESSHGAWLLAQSAGMAGGTEGCEDLLGRLAELSGMPRERLEEGIRAGSFVAVERP